VLPGAPAAGSVAGVLKGSFQRLRRLRESLGEVFDRDFGGDLLITNQLNTKIYPMGVSENFFHYFLSVKVFLALTGRVCAEDGKFSAMWRDVFLET
jgi:hypothetical protein